MPARSRFDGSIVVYRYRCPAAAARAVPPAAELQYRRAHELRNDLVAIERDHAERVAAVWEDHPEVKVAVDEVAAREQDVAALVQRANAERVADRSRQPRTETKNELAAARATLRAAKARLKEARAAAYPVVRPAMAEAQAVRQAAIKAAGTAAKEAGLFWHTHDAVLANHDVAVRRVAERRKAGQPADLRFHRWTGDGRLRVTLMRHEWAHGCGPKRPWPCGQTAPFECPQRTQADPPRTPELLCSGTGPWRNVVRLADHMSPTKCAQSPPRRHGEREVISLRVGSQDGEPVWWDLPVYVHRPLPEGADVTFIEVIRERVAGNSRLSVCITVRIPARAQRDQGDVIGIDLGWRSVPGGLRVAVASSTAPFPPLPEQPELQGVLRPLGSGAVEIVVPDAWRDVLLHVNGVRSIRDQGLDVIRRKVVDALAEGVEGIEATAGEVARWRSANRFAVLARQWPQSHPLAETLLAWRKQDKHLWEIEANERDHILARRRDAWRKVANWLCHTGVAMIAVEEMSLAPLVMVPPVEEGDDQQAVLARAQRAIVAPGELRKVLLAATNRHGIRVQQVDAAGTTRAHVACGYVIDDPAEFAKQVMVWCPRCEVAYDQDVNASLNIISRALGEPSVQP